MNPMERSAAARISPICGSERSASTIAHEHRQVNGIDFIAPVYEIRSEWWGILPEKSAKFRFSQI